MPYLIVRELGAERTFPLLDEEMSIGRSRQNPIQLETDQSSRKHLHGAARGRRWHIADAGSPAGRSSTASRSTRRS
jgi:hypothetical protein